VTEPATSPAASEAAPERASDAPPPPAAAPAATSAFSVRDTLVVARFELGEALRTRLVLVMLLLFMGGGGLGAWGFSQCLGRLEATAAQALGAPQTKKAGASLDRLKHTPVYRQFLRSAVNDDAKADYFVALPPMVVVYAFVALLFTPWLVLFTSSDTIATEVASRAIRYTLLRTGALEYALGKFLGQAVLVFCVIGTCGLTFFVVSWLNLASFDAAGIAWGILSFWPRVFVHTLPFLAFALMASMITSSANIARITALGGAVVLGILNGMAREASPLRVGPVSNVLWDAAQTLAPFSHSDGLMYPRGGEFVRDVLMCLALAVLYFCCGFVRLRRRDI